MIRYAAGRPELVADEVADHELEEILRERRALIGAQGIAVLLALVLPARGGCSVHGHGARLHRGAARARAPQPRAPRLERLMGLM